MTFSDYYLTHVDPDGRAYACEQQRIEDSRAKARADEVWLQGWLWTSIDKDDVKEVIRIIDIHPDWINLKWSDDRTIFYETASRGCSKVTQALLESYPTQSTLVLKDKEIGQTPLHLAALNGHLEIIKLIVQHDPSLMYERDAVGLLPFHSALNNGQAKTVKFFLETVSNPLKFLEFKDRYNRNALERVKDLHGEDSPTAQALVNFSPSILQRINMLVDRIWT